jgi:cytochrome c oxidase assembly protein subunit 15
MISDRALQTWVRRLAAASAVIMFLVLIQGTLVTTTGSADGCGNSWPLCNGELVPQYAVATAIEYSHRLVVSIASVVIVATAIGALWLWRDRLEMRIFVPLMVVTLFLQAGLGAAAVMWPQADAVLALHFGVSLISFASTLLTAVLAYELDGRDRLRDHPIPRALVWTIWGLAAYTYVVVYLGAYVRHSDASLACTDWPLCNGSVFPGVTGPVGTVFTHRVFAGVLVLAMAALLWWTTKLRDTRPDLFWASLVALVLVIAQAASGAFVVITRLDVFATLSHGILVSLFFGTLAYLCVHALPRPAAVRHAAPVPERGEGFAGAPATAGGGD